MKLQELVLFLSLSVLTITPYGRLHCQTLQPDTALTSDSVHQLIMMADSIIRAEDTLLLMNHAKASTRSDTASDTTVSRLDTVSTPKDTLNIITSEADANTVPGFRVQLSSTQDLLQAVSTESLADSLLPNYDVYIVYDAPYYKVRIGDFRSRYEADRAVTYVAGHGFPDAWPVPDNVFRNPLPRKQ